MNNYKDWADVFNKKHFHVFFQKTIASKNFLSAELFLKTYLENGLSNSKAFKQQNIRILKKTNVNMVTACCYQNYKYPKSWTSTVKYKLYVGNGMSDVYSSFRLDENSQNNELFDRTKGKMKINQSTILHPVTLRPYIPGSSIHGAFRSYLVLQYGLKKEHKKLIDFIFGNIDKDNGHSGIVCCFDAHPIAQDAGTLPDDSLEVSVISGGMKDGNIIPLNFINVKKGTKFQFNMRVRPLSESCINTLININNKTDKIEFNLKKDDPLDIQISTIQNRLYALFKEFLSHGSIGARESVGWGEFEDVTEN